MQLSNLNYTLQFGTHNYYSKSSLQCLFIREYQASQNTITYLFIYFIFWVGVGVYTQWKPKTWLQCKQVFDTAIPC